MVKLTTTALISILALATLGLSAPSSHTHIQRNEDTIAQIKADVTDISTKLTTLSANVDVFPTSGGSLINALAISNEALSIASALGKCAADITSNGLIALSDGTSILNSVQSLSDPIHHTLIAIVNKKSAFIALAVGHLDALILQDLKFLRGNTSTFGNAIITFNAALLTPSATALRDTVLGYFDVAIAAYSTTQS